MKEEFFFISQWHLGKIQLDTVYYVWNYDGV